MALTIKRIFPGRGTNDIQLTHVTQVKVDYYFLTQEILKELVDWALFYGKDDAYVALGCKLEPGEETNVG